MKRLVFLRGMGVAMAVCLMRVPATQGAGYALIEQSVKGLGEAYSGASTSREDVSALYYNPAVLPLVENPGLCVGMHVIMPSISYRDAGSGYPRLAMPLQGGRGGNPGETAFIPNLYYGRSFSARGAAGIGINVPYGLTTDYDRDWIGRYHALRSELRVININPAVGFRLHDRLSIGAGLSAQHIHAELTSAVDFGGILAGAGAPVLPQMLDGHASVEGDAWGFGYHAGLLFEPRDGTSIGLAFRSEVSATLEGDATFTVPPQAAALQAAGRFVDADAKADVTLPETLSLGIEQRIGQQLTLKADLLWMRWSRFDELRIRYASNQPDSVTPENWRDSLRYAVGLSYAHDEHWTFRVGAAYDETPIKSKEYRTPRIPDADRTWLSCGATWQASERLGLDMAYTHLMFNDSQIDTAGPTGDRLVGTYKGTVNMISLQLSYAF